MPFKEKLVRGTTCHLELRRWFIGEVLCSQTWKPEFEFQHPCKNLGIAAFVMPVLGGETGGSLKLIASQPNLLFETQASEGPCLKEGWHLRLPCLHMCVHTYIMHKLKILLWTDWTLRRQKHLFKNYVKYCDTIFSEYLLSATLCSVNQRKVLALRKQA